MKTPTIRAVTADHLTMIRLTTDYVTNDTGNNSRTLVSDDTPEPVMMLNHDDTAGPQRGRRHSRRRINTTLPRSSLALPRPTGSGLGLLLYDHRALDIVLLQGPRGVLFLMIEVPPTSSRVQPRPTGSGLRSAVSSLLLYYSQAQS